MTVTENRLKFETFKKKRNKAYLPLPKWFTDVAYAKVLQMINRKEKLLACKYLCDVSKEKNTRNDYGLAWAKKEIVDEIERIGGIVPIIETPAPKSTLGALVKTIEQSKTEPSGFINKQEVLRAIEPFARAINTIERNCGRLNSSLPVYSFMGVTLTVQDFNNLEVLRKKLSR